MILRGGRESGPRAETLAAAGAVLALAIYQIAPPIPALAGWAALVVLAVAFPGAALVAVPVSLPFYLVPRPIAGGWSFSGTEAAILACALAAGLRFVRRPSLPRLSREDALVLLFVGVAVASLAVSIRPRESLRELRTIVVEPVLFYYLVVISVRDRGQITRLAQGLMLAGLAIALIGLYQYAANENIITAEENLRRIRGFYGSPNNLGLFLGRVVPFTVCFLTLGWQDRPVYGAILVPMAVALVLTFSGGAWLGTAAALVFVAVLNGRRALLLAGASLAAVAALATPVLATVERFRMHLNFGEGTSFARVQVWQAALAMIRDHPITGVGLDNFLYYYRDRGYMLASAWREPDISHPHNLVLNAWLSLGLGGLAILLCLLASFFVRGLRLVRRESDPVLRALIGGLLAAMVDFAAHGLIDNSYFAVDLAVIFWLSFAILRMAGRPQAGTATV